MNVNELRSVISKIEEYDLAIDNPMEFLKNLNKRQINNIIRFSFDKDYLTKDEYKLWLINYNDVLENKDLLNYSYFNVICNMIFDQFNEIQVKVINDNCYRISYCKYSHFSNRLIIDIKKILSCKEAYSYNTIYEDLKIILDNLKKVESFNPDSSEYEKNIRKIEKIQENLISIATNPNSIKSSNHNEVMKMVMNADPIKGEAIAKVERCKKSEVYDIREEQDIIMNKPDNFANSIVDFVSKSQDLNHDVYEYCLQGIKNSDSLSKVNAMIEICTDSCFKNYKNKKEIIDIILRCNTEYLEILKKVCSLQPVMSDDNIIEKLKIFFKVNNIEEAAKVSRVIIQQAFNAEPTYNQYDEILYNAYMYVDSKDDFEKELPEEVFEKKLNNK